MGKKEERQSQLFKWNLRDPLSKNPDAGNGFVKVFSGENLTLLRDIMGVPSTTKVLSVTMSVPTSKSIVYVPAWVSITSSNPSGEWLGSVRAVQPKITV